MAFYVGSKKGLNLKLMIKIFLLCTLGGIYKCSCSRPLSSLYCTIPVYAHVFVYAAREGSQKLQALEPNDRADIINSLANLLLDRQEDILAANKRDIDIAKEQGKDF